MGHLTYNTRLVFDDQKDHKRLLDMLSAYTEAFNECSKVKFSSVKENSIVLLHSKFYKQYRTSNPTLPSILVVQAEQECLSAYRGVKSNKHKISKPISRNHGKQSVRLNKCSYSYKQETKVFSIVSMEKRVKCKLYLFPKLEELLSKYKFADPLLFTNENQVWMALTFDIPEIPLFSTLALGVDLGVRNFAATSEGNLYKDNKFNERKRRLRYNKDILKSKKRNSHSSRYKLRAIKHKERNQNKNFCHHLANKILKDTPADTIVLENLKSLKVKKHKYQNKNRISQVPFFLIRTILTYKAALLNKQVITVCPSYTSQIDHRTGLKDGIRQGCRYIGKDGFIQHADINAAMNIAARSKHPVSQCLKPLTYGQATVITPIVGRSFIGKPNSIAVGK
jgi:IS605 OrfB family transposase